MPTMTFKGSPLTVLGPTLTVGQKAPAFTLLDAELKERSLSGFASQTKIICTVPSLDTPVCEEETKRFNTEAASFSRNTVVICVSMDLPFAQKRFCATFGIKNVVTLSDHRDASFGKAYGVFIDGLRLLGRAVFVVSTDNTLLSVQYVTEMTQHPDYAAVFDTLKSIR